MIPSKSEEREFAASSKTAAGVYYFSTYPQTKLVSFGLDINF